MRESLTLLSESSFKSVFISLVGNPPIKIARGHDEESLVHFLQHPHAVDDERKGPSQPDVGSGCEEAAGERPGGHSHGRPRHEVAQR